MKKGEFLTVAMDQCNCITIYMWKDNNIVTVVSFVHWDEPLKTTETRRKAVQISDCITKYSRTVFGLDLADRKMRNTELACNAKLGYFLIFLIV